MPIYPYKCQECGHQFDALQKMSDPLLVDCPACGKSSLRKQLTAAAFKLKGTGWYETDFKNSGKKASDKKSASADSSDSSSDQNASKTDSTSSSNAAPSKSSSSPAVNQSSTSQQPSSSAITAADS